MIGQDMLRLNPELMFLKMGGSLITEKSRPHTPREEVINEIAEEIKVALDEKPERRIVLGHGSGSFGHVPAKKYGTRQGVRTEDEWLGFVDVWRQAAALNHLVMDALTKHGVPAVAISPLTAITASAGEIVEWNLVPIASALEHGLIPVVYGDVVFDQSWGGTILSTEELFAYLVPALRPSSILLAGVERGVWMDYPACQVIYDRITPAVMDSITFAIDKSAFIDVTGGMQSKVAFCINLVKRFPSMQVLIFDGKEPKNLKKALNGEHIGTLIGW
jgi:isopentenyl phosphate kinase